MNRYGWPIALVLISLLLLSGCRSAAPLVEPAAPPAPSAAAPPVAGGAVAALEGTLERIYTQVNPSVVNIRVVERSQTRVPQVPGFPFREPPTPGEPREFFRRGLGSGFIWDKEGHIVTNNHVVSGAERITVTFSDGSIVQGKLVGADRDSDLAVVKVDAPGELLRQVQLADSTQLKVGQLTVAIGNPFGLQGTMTVGFISGLGRTLPVEPENEEELNYNIPDIIQTDASINPGNSGGVLVDEQGRVMGVTSAIVSPVRASAGIGFAIPSAIVQKVVPTLIKAGRYEHPWLGISGTSLTPDLAKAMGLKTDQRGALVIDVLSDSPAQRAGLRGSDRPVTIDGESARVGGDVIVAMDKQTIKAMDELIAYLARAIQVGQTATLTVLRQGKTETVTVTLAARPQTQRQRVQVESAAGGGAWLGIQGLDVTPEVAQAMNLPSGQPGALVERVVSGSPAEKAGLKAGDRPLVIEGRRLLVGGDIIVAVNGQTVRRLEDLQAFLRRAKPGQKVRLTVLRNREQIRVEATLAELPS